MASGGGSKLCVVCSLSVVGEEEEMGVQIGVGNRGGGGITPCCSNFLSNKSLSRFCGELQLCGSYGGYHDDKLFEASSFLGALEGSADVFFVCGECMEVITKAMEKRAQLEEEELEVWKLQVQMLEKMKVLKECAGLYFKEMEKIMGRVRSAEIEVDVGMGDPRRKMNIKRLIKFREKILDVVAYLAIFQDDVSHKLLTKTGNEASKTQEEISIPMEDEDPFGVSGDLFDAPHSPVSPMVDGHEEDFSDSQVSNDHQEDEHTKVEPSEARDDHCEESYPELEEPILKKKRISRTSKSVVKRKSNARISAAPKRRKTPSQNPSKPISVSSKPAAAPSAFQVSYQASIEKQNEALSRIDFSGMSKLRKDLVEFVVRRQVATTEMKSSNQESSPQPYDFETLTEQDEWEYNSSTDQITIAGYEMEVTEDKPNLLEILCKSCGFQCSKTFPPNPNEKAIHSNIEVFQRSAFNHVFRHHLEAFQCNLCPFKATSLKTFKDHLEYHRDPQSFQCDICGKEFEQKDTLRHHKKLHRTNQDHIFPCSVCGKGFVRRDDMEKHEETHLPQEERPHVTCPLCGQRMLKKSFATHKLFYCIAKAPIICSICGNKFSSKRYLKKHTDRIHNSEEARKCQECGEPFKKWKDLIDHQISAHPQNNKKREECRKGCGKLFLLPFYKEKHEAKCKGPEGPG